MNLWSRHPYLRWWTLAAGVVVAAFLWHNLASREPARNAPPASSNRASNANNATNATAAAPPASTNAAATTTNLAAQPNAGASNAVPGAPASPAGAVGAMPPGMPVSAGMMPGAPGVMPGMSGAGVAGKEVKPLSPDEEIQLTFQRANIDVIVQWLARATGKSVIKHPRVQCQLTIVSSRKMRVREAVELIYRALSLEGHTAIETSRSILIVPQGQEPKIEPELVDSAEKELPAGRQRVMKIFQIRHATPAEVSGKVRAVLSDKGSIEVAERANQLIITDFADNVRLAGELIEQLDVPASGDVVIEFYPLKHADASEVASLLTMVINAQPAPPSSGSSASGGGPSISRVISSSSGPVRISGGSPNPPSPPTPSPPSPAPSPSAPSTGTTTPPVRVWADKTANRLIVAAPKARQAEVARLIELLDQEKPRDLSIRVIQLHHVSAADLVRDLAPLFQKMSGQTLKETIEVTANARANALVVLSSEANFKAIEALVSTLDTEQAQQRVLRAFPLKNADAEDVARQLRELHEEQAGRSRYPFYVFSPSPMGGREPEKPTFVADRRRNTVIVQAPAPMLDDIGRLIEELDAPVSEENLAPRIFRLKYVSAVDLEDILNELFVQRRSQRSYWDPYYDYYTSTSEEAGMGRLAGKVRITSEPYANAIIVTAKSTEVLDTVASLIRELDQPSEAGETTFRVSLRFAKAATVANNLNILFAKSGSPPLRPTATAAQPARTGAPAQTQGTPAEASFELEAESETQTYYPWLGGQPDTFRSFDGRSTVRPVSDLIGRVRVVPDPRSNALLVSANVHLFPQVLKLINELDEPTPQVLIDAKIIEVSSDWQERLGVRWSPDGGAVFTPEDLDNSIRLNAGSQYLKGFGGLTRVNSPASAGLAGALTTLRSGVIDSSINLDFLVQFLRKTTDASVLSEPKINVADNEVGRLFVGQQVPFIERSQSTDVGALNQTFSYKNVGVILEVTPHINATGDVALKIRAESSTIVPGQTLFGGAILDTRNFKTDVTVKDGQTLVLGGIMQRQEAETVRKTPVLGSIPGLGLLFRKKDKTVRDVELLVFLRPRIVRTPEEAEALRQQVEQEAPLIQRFRLERRAAADEGPGDSAREHP
ncbi:MAG: hypothetical protein D6766_02855 [Verrucomicrobia bacterium]|nr:MAG: hypothetical protein D6766_02855 [Verrucomicrobiota bacterium]